MNALMPLQLADGKLHYIAGGSFMDAPTEAFGIKLAREVHMPCDIALDIGDFGVPSEEHKILMAAERALECMREDMPVYAGCFAGIGRTGLFLGILARATGIDDPLRYVRTYYHPKSIETQAQYDFLMQLDVRALHKRFGVAPIGSLHWSHLGVPASDLEKVEALSAKWEPMRAFWIEKERNPNFLNFKMWKEDLVLKNRQSDGEQQSPQDSGTKVQGCTENKVQPSVQNEQAQYEENKPWLQGQKRRV